MEAVAGVRLALSTVIPGLAPGTHAPGGGVDGRAKPGHDGCVL
ncbi:hypothetical protein [Alsobacter metallidurans]|nr:hypothetical protein [Alsobacter metallidurans]